MHFSLCFNILCLTVTPAVGLSAESSSVDARIRVGSFNLWRQKDEGVLSTIAKEIQETVPAMPDVLALQEVIFEGRKGSAETLAQPLGYDYLYKVQRLSDDEGLALLSKRPILFEEALHHDAMPDCLFLCMTRVSILIEYDDPKIGRVRVINSHLSSKENEGRVRAEQISEVLQWLKKRDAVQSAELTIWAGDFNAETSDPELDQVRNFMPEAGFEFLNFNSIEPSWGLRGDKPRRIDQIFVSAAAKWNVELESENLLLHSPMLRPGEPYAQFPPSDHRLLYHRYKLLSLVSPQLY